MKFEGWEGSWMNCWSLYSKLTGRNETRSYKNETGSQNMKNAVTYLQALITNYKFIQVCLIVMTEILNSE